MKNKSEMTQIEKLREEYHGYAERVASGEEVNGWKDDPAFAELIAKKQERVTAHNFK